MGQNDFCCAEGCNHERSRGATCNFYKIPADKKLKSAWLSKISRVSKVIKNGNVVTQPWVPSKSSKLCGCHFEEPPPAKSRKKWFKVPSIFSHRPVTRKPPRRNPKERLCLPGTLGDCTQLDTITTDANICDRDTSPDASIEEVNEIQQPTDHDYISTKTDERSYQLVQDNPDLADYIKRSDECKEKSEQFNHCLTTAQLLKFDFIKKDTKLFNYYTGLKLEVFMALFKYLEPKASVMKYPIGARTVLFQHFGESKIKKPGKPRSLSLEEEMFFTLVKLKLGLQTTDCAVRYGIATSTFSSIFTAWVTLLSQELEKICKMPATTETDCHQQASCFEEFPNVRVIVDCTELFAETPSSVGAHKQFHSNYKHHSTVKFLVGMNTGGAIIYVSDMYGGRASDKFITNESVDLLQSLNTGEKVMADRGFTIQDDLPPGVKLVIPSFKHKDKSQFKKEELLANKKISEARVHIERAIRKIKQFQILKQEMKLTQVDVYCSIFKACAYLVNFQDPFLKS